MTIPTRTRDLLGFTCFGFAAIIAGQAAFHQPTILGWLYTLHNAILAILYLKRMPATKYDRIGLWLGLIAAFLPTLSPIHTSHWYLTLPALAGYGLILWSLITLGRRFGIAPADRGITNRGPYRYLRHPMYLGELVFRLAMAFESPNLVLSLFVAGLLVILQCWRILREERLISGYSCYARLVPWRMVPFLW